MFGLGILLLLIAVIMFYVWRLWLRLHGQTWKPSGRWESRTAAMHEYLATQPSMFGSMTRAQKIMVAVMMIAILSVYAVVVRSLMNR